MNTPVSNQVVVEAKPWYKSWTVLANVPIVLSVLVDYAVGEGFAFTNEPWFLGLVGIVNLALRFKTDRPVAASPKDVAIPRTAS